MSLDLLEVKDLAIEDVDYLLSLGSDPTKDTYCVVSCWEGKPFAIGGWHHSKHGVIKVFAIPTPEIFLMPLVFVRIGIKWVEYLEAQPWCKRLVAMSLDSEKLNRWMKTLGFVYEKPLPAYAMGRDFNLWVKITNDIRRNI